MFHRAALPAGGPPALRGRRRFQGSPVTIRSMQNSRVLAIALALIALILFLTDIRYDSPRPVAADAPMDGFSAERARPILEHLVGDGVPHPIGSAANAVVRDRITTRLRALGYSPEIQQAFVCAPHGTCATVENILARLPGSEGGKAVLLAVHYDSVWAGPGSSDDAMAVAATLEIARALKASAPLRHDVIFLIDDGEEQGLLGARAFAAGHPWAKDVAAVVNVEARGTSGASLMFETNAGNRNVVSLAAKALPRPATNSIYYTIYTLLPNDTDFTVFKERGWPGVNFGIVGDAARYHTPMDNFAMASPGSMQHHGENALAMIRAFGNSDLDLRSAGDAVFFDVFTLFVVSWPASITVVLAIVALVLILFVALIRVRRREMTFADVLWGGGLFVALAASTGLVAFIMSKLLEAGGAYPNLWVANPAPSIAVFWMLPLAILAIFAAAFRRRKADGLWAGTWIVMSVAGLVVAGIYPGISYLFVVPALIAGIAALPLALRKRTSSLGVPGLLGALAAASLMFPVGWMLYDGMGTPIFMSVSLVASLVAATLLPLAVTAPPLHIRVIFGTAIVVVLIGAILAISLPKATEETPSPMSITLFHDLDSDSSRWVLDVDEESLPGTLHELGFATSNAAVYGWAPEPRPLVKEAGGDRKVEAPELTVLQVQKTRDGHAVRVRLRSPRGAPRAGVYVPVTRVLGAVVDGTEIPKRSSRRRNSRLQWQSYLVTTMPAEGVEMVLLFSGQEPVEAFAWDAAPLTPAEGKEVLAARPSTHVPIGAGDRSVIARRVKLVMAE